VGSRAMFTALNAAIAANKIEPVVDKVFPLADARAAFEYLQSGSHFGKVVLAV
jgi:NADPH:quinone reductase-like Zn-dependent oxidoreductase